MVSASIIDGVPNLRELGGLRASNNQRVRPHVLFRAELLTDAALHEANAVWVEEDLPAYRALGLRTVIDLRFDGETSRSPSAWTRATNAAYISIPIDEGAPGGSNDFLASLADGSRTSFTAEDMAQYYVDMFEARKSEFALVISTLAEPRRLPALIHCSAGKDRTGLAVALVLSALDVDRESILDDYAETGVRRPDRALLYSDMLAAHGVDVRDVEAMFDAPPDALRLALEHLDRQYGSVTGYLRGAGISDSALDRLRSALLTSGDEGEEESDAMARLGH